MMKLRPIIVDAEGMILGGNMRFKALKELGYKEVPAEWIKYDGELTNEEKQRFIAVDNVPFGDWDFDILANEWDQDKLIEWGLELPDFNTAIPWRAEDQEEMFADLNGDGIETVCGYRLSSIWYDMTSNNDVRNYMMELPPNLNAKNGATVKLNYSRTNAEETERIVKTYMREGDLFFEMCCGWMTFSSTAKYFGYSGKGGDIWDESLNFCKEQIAKMPGKGKVKVIYADCRDTKELDNYYDFVHSNPPFFSLESYSNNNNDLASLGRYDLWLNAMSDMGKEAERILKSGGLANFVINDFRKNGVVVNMHSDFINAILRKSNLKLHDLVIAEVISQALRFRKHDYEKRRTVKCHEYIITFKKN